MLYDNNLKVRIAAIMELLHTLTYGTESHIYQLILIYLCT